VVVPDEQLSEEVEELLLCSLLEDSSSGLSSSGLSSPVSSSSGLSSLPFFPFLPLPGGLEQDLTKGIRMQGRLKEGKPGKLKETSGQTIGPIDFQDGILGIQIRIALAAPPQSGHEMTGRMMSWLLPSSVVVVSNHVLAVPLILTAWVLQPGGMLVIIPSESVGKNDQIGRLDVSVVESSLGCGFAQKYDVSQPNGKRASVVGIGIPVIELGTTHFGSEIVGVDDTGMGLGPGCAQNDEVSQPSGKRASVVAINIPGIELGSKHFGSGIGEAVDDSTIGIIECPGFGDQADVSEPVMCGKGNSSVVELDLWSGPFHDGSREDSDELDEETAVVDSNVGL
jgi:hypothetical protein